MQIRILCSPAAKGLNPQKNRASHSIESTAGCTLSGLKPTLGTVSLTLYIKRCLKEEVVYKYQQWCEDLPSVIKIETVSSHGHFLYASHSLPPRETVRFVSDLFKEQSVALCLTFYFQMIGSDIGHLQIIFEAVRGNGDYGSIAIDDISIGSDQCFITPHSAAPDLSGKRYCILE
ncbi:hypothetical protein GQR58_015322 [Nymphon striatum]|nr:hypothetical protein GQR58_015322 [Nymphon striatum]